MDSIQYPNCSLQVHQRSVLVLPLLLKVANILPPINHTIQNLSLHIKINCSQRECVRFEYNQVVNLTPQFYFLFAVPRYNDSSQEQRSYSLIVFALLVQVHPQSDSSELSGRWLAHLGILLSFQIEEMLRSAADIIRKTNQKTLKREAIKFLSSNLG